MKNTQYLTVSSVRKPLLFQNHKIFIKETICWCLFNLSNIVKCLPSPVNGNKIKTLLAIIKTKCTSVIKGFPIGMCRYIN